MMADHDLTKAPKALALLEQAMAQGDHRAEYAIGTWYLHGFHFKRDIRRGTAMIARAAEKGVADAAFDLAVSYEIGEGRKANASKALCYYMRAFLLGDRSAAVEVERLLYWGDASIRNRALSREFRGIALEFEDR